MRRGLANDGNEEVGDAGRANLAKFSERLAIATVEQEHAAAKPVALGDGFESAGGRKLIGADGQLGIARLDLLHRAGENDAAAIDEQHVRQNALDLLDLVRG
ncbi:MAG: hypothetical protein ACRD3E_12950, partial [Terriglobales bacterium]